MCYKIPECIITSMTSMQMLTTKTLFLIGLQLLALSRREHKPLGQDGGQYS